MNIVSFNTQPPEGGWMTYYETSRPDWGFNTQPPEGGWGIYDTTLNLDHLFQHTAARRRLDDRSVRPINRSEVSTHSRPKAAGYIFSCLVDHFGVSTHSRPKAAGFSKWS